MSAQQFNSNLNYSILRISKVHYRFHIPEGPISLMFYYMSISRVRYPVLNTIFTTTKKKKLKRCIFEMNSKKQPLDIGRTFLPPLLFQLDTYYDPPDHYSLLSDSLLMSVIMVVATWRLKDERIFHCQSFGMLCTQIFG